MRNLTKLIIILAFAAVSLASCMEQKRKFVVGVSQCSEDVWRQKLNSELKMAAYLYDDIELRIESANDNDSLQARQIDRFVEEGVDLLIVAPSRVSVAPAINRAYDRGIPVILFDRKTGSDKYTAFIGSDNYEMGRAMGEFIAAQLNGHGRVAELCGQHGSSPANDRHNGFMAAMRRHPGIRVVASLQTDWTASCCERATDSLLDSHADIDFIFAHSDRMAMGARRALLKHGLQQRVKLCGIDAMPQRGGGMQLVRDGILAASYIYPTRGDEVMQLAADILSHRPYRRENLLRSALVTKDNAKVLLMQNEEMERQTRNLAALSQKIGQAMDDLYAQYAFAAALGVIVLLLIVACAYAYYAYLTKARFSERLQESYEKQRRLTEEVERMTQGQLRFFTNVSHELRTPLTLIDGPAAQLCLDRSLNSESHGLAVLISHNAKVLAQLVNEILDFRKVQNGKATLRLSRFDMGEAITQWNANFSEEAAKRHIDMVFANDSKDENDNLVIADRNKMSHVYSNLISNAMKFTPKNGRITTTLERRGADLVISVEDTGQGIDKADLPNLFQRFFQSKNSIGGTGIGLAIVKAYVELHHGSVSVDSELGKGTCFRVTIPAEQKGGIEAEEAETDSGMDAVAGLVGTEDGGMEAGQNAERLVEEDGEGRPEVLVIDDNAGMRQYLRSILKGRYDVMAASDGREGLAVARREVPELVVCDVMMPVMDGLEFCKALKADPVTSHIPVILLTAKSLDEQRAEGYDSGADSYITKPFDGNVLLSRIGNLLAERRQLKSIFAENSGADGGDAKLGDQDRTFVSKLKAVVRDNLGDSSFGVESIGAAIGLSRVQLYRKTKALTGLSPVELLRKARLAKGRRLLETTDMTVAEVSYQVGFTSPSYFTKCFKDEFGISPGSIER